MKTKLFSLLIIPVLFCGACSSSDDSTRTEPQQISNVELFSLTTN